MNVNFAQAKYYHPNISKLQMQQETAKTSNNQSTNEITATTNRSMSELLKSYQQEKLARFNVLPSLTDGANGNGMQGSLDNSYAAGLNSGR